MLKSLSIPVVDPSQVGEARRAANRLGSEVGFNENLLGTLGIISTEMATNLHKHAKGGELILRKLKDGDRLGIELLSVDRGPGISEVARCMQDGYSTAGTKGNGLGSIKRLSHVFDIYSLPQGTAIVSQIWAKPAPANASRLDIGAVCLPYPGETLCGDAWSTFTSGLNHSVVVADGLGHGKEAATASDQAIVIFDETPDVSPQVLLQRMHGALHSTRGAAVLLLSFNSHDRKIVCSGIGNVSCAMVRGDVSKSFVSLNGTVGHQAQRTQEFSYDWLPASLLLFFSDGLQTKWKLDSFPGLQMRHPSLVAAVLYRDFRRERDDVTILVVREAPKIAQT